MTDFKSKFNFLIFTSDNRTLTIYQSSKGLKLKPRSSNQKISAKMNIITHKDETVSLVFLKGGKIFSCYCASPLKKPVLKLKAVNGINNFVKNFCFNKKVEADQRIYFESCAKAGWFIHASKNEVTINNSKNMEAKCFKMEKIE